MRPEVETAAKSPLYPIDRYTSISKGTADLNILAQRGSTAVLICIFSILSACGGGSSGGGDTSTESALQASASSEISEITSGESLIEEAGDGFVSSTSSGGGGIAVDDEAEASTVNRVDGSGSGFAGSLESNGSPDLQSENSVGSRPKPPAATPKPEPAPSPRPEPTPAPPSAPAPPPAPAPAPAPAPQPAPPKTELDVDSTSPAPNSKNRALTTEVKIAFSEGLIPATVNSGNLQIRKAGNPIRINIEHSAGSDEVRLVPKLSLSPDTVYQVVVKDGLMSQSGDEADWKSWQFRTLESAGETSQGTVDGCMSAVDVQMLKAVNAARSSARSCGGTSYSAQPALRWSCKLDSAATTHARDMASQHFFSHTGSDGSRMGQRMSNAGYSWSSAGENIAGGQYSVGNVMKGWMSSPGHCRNIMSSGVTEMGASLVTVAPGSAQYSRYWVQNFGRPN